MSNVFTKKVFVDRPEAQKEKVSLKRYLGGFLLGFILLIILGFAAFKIGDFFNSLSKNWQEIKFAYEKPSIVQTVRTNYESQQKKMEQSFLKTQKSSEDQLIDAVVQKLKSDDLK